MKAWCLQNAFGLNNLKIIEKRSPHSISPNEIRVKIKACSLNYRDLLVLEGHYNKKQQLPLIPLSDGAGLVMEIGSEVAEFKVGDKVCLTFPQNMKNTLGSPLDGVLQEEIIVSENGLVKFPESLSYIEAASLPCAGVTAFNAIYTQGVLKPGDFVLLEGTGGVSLFALQFANALGLKTIVLTSSHEKMVKLKELKATHIINYNEHIDWQKNVLDITKNNGVKSVIEVGGASTFARALECLSKNGTMFLIGILGGTTTKADLLPILMKGLRIQGIFVGSRSVFQAMNRHVEHAGIHPVIDKVFPFNEACEALYYLKSQKHFGKICIQFDG